MRMCPYTRSKIGCVKLDDDVAKHGCKNCNIYKAKKKEAI